jgi:O-succinylbenzoate synthase
MDGPAGPVVAIREIRLHEVAVPLVRPFRTSFGEERVKRAVLVEVRGDDVAGWGECAASDQPRYSEEWIDAAWTALRRFMAPSLLEMGPISHPTDVAARLQWIRGNRMSKAAVEAAVTDAWLRLRSRGLGSFVGAVRDRVACGVSVGIASSAEAMLEEIQGYVLRGYRRVKLKIEPGRDIDVVRRVREALPRMPLSVDANAAYVPDDLRVFQALDELDLVMIEQPFHHEDLTDHARLQAKIRTPICLDESIRSAHDAAAALDLGSCRIINIKPGRVGGLLEAVRIHDVARERGAPVWIGGMLETGVGRAVNVALAALPGVTLPGDTSGSDRYFTEDVTEPFDVSTDGTMAVPAGPGIGVAPHGDRLEACTVRTVALHA